MNELGTQFIGNRMKALLRSQIEADLTRLEQRVGGFGCERYVLHSNFFCDRFQSDFPDLPTGSRPRKK